MDVADRLKDLAARIPRQLGHINTEEATKNALVLPFLAALGYNVFDPTEVTPELDADVGVKKGEKVDYAVLSDGQPIMLVECKCSKTNLDNAHASQLYRYFSVTPVRVAILTNGVVYRFFSDLDAPNKMDSRPFLEVNLTALDDQNLRQLRRFSKGQFEIDAVLADASEMMYTNQIKRVLNQQLTDPAPDFVRFIASQVYEGRMTQQVREQFTDLTRRALQQFVSERVADRLKLALAREEGSGEHEPLEEDAVPVSDDGIETTSDELQAFYIVQAIAAEVVDPKRIVIRDQKTYCSVLLDDNNRKPVCRFYFNGRQKFVGVFNEAKDETKIPIDAPVDLYQMAPQLKDGAKRYA